MGASVYAVIALVATALGASIAPENALERSTCGRVWLTVHSSEFQSSGTRVLDALELNWDFTGCPIIPETIGLYNARPLVMVQPLVEYPVPTQAGYLITNVSLGEASLPAGWTNGAGQKGPQCLWPWIAAVRDKVLAHNCLKIQPTWMEDNGDKINKMRIGELALPGTHNAGAWKFDTEISTLSRDSFILCQDRSIWAQLVHGIRYFDFRVAYYDSYANEDDRYWLNHNLIRIRPLVPLLREIRAFLDATKEVIFLDAHHFPIGFYNTNNVPIWHVHNGLLEIVRRELGPHLALAVDFHTGVGTRGPTVQQLLDANKRLVFSYVDNLVVNENNWLWPNLPHLWANTNSVSELFRYLDNAIATSPQHNARSPMHSAMAQTTPSVFDILMGRGSIRDNADLVNREVTERLSTVWRRNANIVSTDFFLGNDVIDVSIAITVERSDRL